MAIDKPRVTRRLWVAIGAVLAVNIMLFIYSVANWLWG